MTALGRDLLMRIRDEQIIAGLTDVTLSWSGESVEITSNEDEGIRRLDEMSGQEQIEISADFISKDYQLLILALDRQQSKLLQNIQIDWPRLSSSGNTIRLRGDFRLSSFEQSANYKEAITGSISLESAGPWTFINENAGG